MPFLEPDVRHPPAASLDHDGADPAGLSITAMDVLISAYGHVTGRECVGHALIRVGQCVEGLQVTPEFHAVVGRLDQTNGDELAHPATELWLHDEVGDHVTRAVDH